MKRRPKSKRPELTPHERGRAASFAWAKLLATDASETARMAQVDAMIAAHKAREDGKARHAARRKVGTDWESVRAAIIADGHAELLDPPIRAKELHRLPQLCERSAESVQTFIKFLREQYVIPSKDK